MPDYKCQNNEIRMLLYYDNIGHSIWASRVKSYRYRYDLGCVWEKQGIQNQTLILFKSSRCQLEWYNECNTNINI